MNINPHHKDEHLATDKEPTKIKGYRDLSEKEIAMMNKIKEKGAELGDLIVQLEPFADHRWLAIGRTEIQQGLMALTRSIAKPDFF